MGSYSSVKAGGVILSGLILVGSLAFSLGGIMDIEWQWVALASFVVFCGFMWWTFSGLQQRIQ